MFGTWRDTAKVGDRAGLNGGSACASFVTLAYVCVRRQMPCNYQRPTSRMNRAAKSSQRHCKLKVGDSCKKYFATHAHKEVLIGRRGQVDKHQCSLALAWATQIM